MIPDFNMEEYDYFGWTLEGATKDILRRMVEHYNTYIVATQNYKEKNDNGKA